tara:strand:- start:1167 stop:1514 length:348 start_codon:yes stop_codon:yes gene_type:complete
MSTYYKLTNPIPLVNFLSNEKFINNVSVIFNHEENAKYFFDGKNYVHFALDKHGNVIELYRYGGNHPDFIILKILHFKTDVVSEHDEEFNNIYSNDSKIITVNINEITNREEIKK